jgi:hypothetical protein
MPATATDGSWAAPLAMPVNNVWYVLALYISTFDHVADLLHSKPDSLARNEQSPAQSLDELSFLFIPFCQNDTNTAFSNGLVTGETSMTWKCLLY